MHSNSTVKKQMAKHMYMKGSGTPGFHNSMHRSRLPIQQFQFVCSQRKMGRTMFVD